MSRKTILIDVTQQHIDDGEPGHPWSCPIALALDAAGLRSPWVQITRWGIASAVGPDPRAPLSRRAAKFVDAFDAGQPVKPTRFRLPLPEGVTPT
jgi:hypothetical protein